MTNYAGEGSGGLPFVPASLIWRSPPTITGPVLLHSALIFWLVEVLRPRMIAGIVCGQRPEGRAFDLSVHASQKAGLSTATLLVLPDDDEYGGGRAAANAQVMHRVVRGSAQLNTHLETGSVDLLVIDGSPGSEVSTALRADWSAVLSDRAVVLWHDAGASDPDAVLTALGVPPTAVLALSRGRGLRVAVSGNHAAAEIRALCGEPPSEATTTLLNLFIRLGEGAIAEVQVSGGRAAEANIRQLQQQLLNGTKRMQRVERQLGLMENSLSWRITRPLRTAKAWVTAPARSGLRGRLSARLSGRGQSAASGASGPKVPSFAPPSPIAREISTLGWPEVEPNGKPVVIGVMDQFTAQSFGPELNLIQPRPDNWYALAEKHRPSFFFIESAWQGNFGSWQYRVAHYTNKPGQEIADICDYARQNGIPTIFLNKEDPVHHEKFMVTAKLASHIFTTDENMVPSYIAKTGNRSVHVSPFAAQPMLHKPAALADRRDRICFAGSWYGNRHSERAEAMAWLLRAAKPFGLDIYDRNFGTGIFPFPEEFADCVRGSLPYPQLCKEYARYRVFLNVNSVTTSPTMFSRRVFELLACGTPVVSTWSQGIEDMLGTDAVWMVRSEAEAEEAVRILMTDDAEWRRRSLSGIRTIFSNHTYAHRLNDIFRALGMEDRTAVDPPIRLIAHGEDAASVERLIRFADSQSYANFMLAIVAPGYERTSSERVRFLPSDEAAGWIAADGSRALVGRIWPDATYGPDYLRDLANAHQYAPNAKGWAKAIDRDCFGFDHATIPAATLWRSDAFPADLAELDTASASSDLYVIDSDQFEAGTKG